LKQLGLAIQNYESAHAFLPASGIVSLQNASMGPVNYRSFEQRTDIQFSWAVLILPYLEEQNLYDRFDFTREIFLQPEAPQATFLSSLRCPTDNAYGRYFYDERVTRGASLAKGNYAAFCTPYHTNLQMVHRGALVGEGQPLRRITDGLANTLLISEVRTLDNPQDERGAWSLSWTAASLLAFDMHQSESIPFDSTYVAESKYDYQTQTPNTLGPNADMLQICPDPEQAQFEGMPCFDWHSHYYLSAAPRSLHPGGVNAVYLDGHVGFLPDNINEYVMAYLISIADGQVVDAGN
jgi:prepilin-type processing-associated H-X9-DG protein